MGQKEKTTGKITMEYLDKYGTMPDGKPTPSLKLARIIYADHPLSFSSVEAARKSIRTYRGQSGEKHRTDMATKKYYIEELPRNPYNLPESDETVWEPYKINGERLLVLSDIHIPYHSVSAITAAIKWAKKRKPDTILLNGDTLDSFHLSRFVKEPKKRDFAGELEVFRQFMVALKAEFPKANIIFKEGNHDERYKHFLYTKANELAGIDEFQLENIVRSRAGVIEYVGEKRILKAGDLNIIHGHEFAGGVFSPVNIARGLFLKAKVSAMQGHNHQTSEHTETDMNGRMTTTWSVGCLSELHPQYMPLNKWNHGFAFIEIDKDGSFEVQNKRIHKGEVL